MVSHPSAKASHEPMGGSAFSSASVSATPLTRSAAVIFVCVLVFILCTLYVASLPSHLHRAANFEHVNGAPIAAEACAWHAAQPSTKSNSTGRWPSGRIQARRFRRAR